ncbi:MAG: Cys-tRNA(Pro) deacylase [Gammaproteobacteria bacterium]
MTPAVNAARRAGVIHRIHEYRHDPGTRSFGDEAARALGVAAERVFKTLVVELDGDAGRLAVAVVPVARQLDLKACASVFRAKRAALAGHADAERATGYVLGGISPLGQRKPLPTVLDASAARFETIYVSGGRRGLEIELGPADLLRLTDGRSAPISR